MIGGCIDKMQAQSCGTCTRRDDCAFVVPEALGFLLSSLRRAPAAGEEAPAARHPFFDFIGKVAQGIARRRSSSPKTSVRRMVERRLEPLLADGPVRIDRMARELGFSRQTLYRRLKAEGTTFEAVLDALRHRLALRYICDQGLAVKSATYRLGFSDPAAFSRAFKRWTGVSPNSLRGKKSQ